MEERRTAELLSDFDDYKIEVAGEAELGDEPPPQDQSRPQKSAPKRKTKKAH